MNAPNPERPVERESERDRAASTIAGQLTQRGVRLFGDERGDALASLLSAVERFEAARARRGGDSFTNAPDSSQPDDPALVLPVRAEDESVGAYVSRILAAATRLERTVR